MGCFNVACNLTNHSMYSGEAVFIGLVRSPFASVDKNAYMCYNHAVFSPLFLPIYGELDTYGGFDSFKKTKYTNYLESLGIDILDLVNCNVPKKLGIEVTGTFISMEALEHCRQYIYNDFGDNVAKFNVTLGLLDMLGLSYTEIGYNQYYLNTNPEIKINTGFFFNDGSYSYKGEVSKLPFDKFLFKHGIDVKKEYAKIKKNETNFTLYIRNKLQKYKPYDRKKLDDICDRIPDVSPEERQFYFDCSGGMRGYDAIDSIRWLFGDLYLKAPYKEFILDHYLANWESFLPEMSDLSTLNFALGHSNKFWHPQSNGFQHGSKYQEYNLAMLQKKLSRLPQDDFNSLKEDKDTSWGKSEKERLLNNDFYREHRMGNTFKNL